MRHQGRLVSASLASRTTPPPTNGQNFWPGAGNPPPPGARRPLTCRRGLHTLGQFFTVRQVEPVDDTLWRPGRLLLSEKPNCLRRRVDLGRDYAPEQSGGRVLPPKTAMWGSGWAIRRPPVNLGRGLALQFGFGPRCPPFSGGIASKAERGRGETSIITPSVWGQNCSRSARLPRVSGDNTPAAYFVRAPFQLYGCRSLYAR